MDNKTEKKSRYTDAQRRATNKYRNSKAKIELFMEQEQKERIKQAAADAGKSVNQYILDKIL